MNDFLITPAAGQARARFLFAHGAGAPMDSEFMQEISEGLARAGIEVLRFEFPYMEERRQTGKRRPPNRMPELEACFLQQVQAAAAISPALPLFIGGKSMGGRVASLVAEGLFGEGLVSGLVCLGYPFHPTGKPDKLRTAHLLPMTCPTLIVQGTRDPLGNQDEVSAYGLPGHFVVHWLEDGDHDFKPRRASGYSRAEHWQAAVAAIAEFSSPARES